MDPHSFCYRLTYSSVRYNNHTSAQASTSFTLTCLRRPSKLPPSRLSLNGTTSKPASIRQSPTSRMLLRMELTSWGFLRCGFPVIHGALWLQYHPDSALWLSKIQRSMWANSPVDNVAFMDEYFRNSLCRESEEMDRICAAVREAGMFVVLGYSERYKGSLYIAQVWAILRISSLR